MDEDLSDGQLMTRQPELFGAGDVECRQMCQAAEGYARTGKIAARNEERAAAMLEALLQGKSLRAIQREFQVDGRTVRAVQGVYEREGKLPALKERMSRKLGHAMELGVENAVAMLEAGDVPANVIPVMVGVFADKKAMIDGDATVRVEHQERRVLGAQEWLETVKRVKARVQEGGPVDV